MTKFKNDVCEVEFDVTTLTFKDLKDPKATQKTAVSKSELFRQLYDLGMEVSEIAKECGSHYSFVHGVISKSREMRSTHKASKSDAIRDLAAMGMTPGEISKELNSNYSFVFSVVKAYKATPEFAKRQAEIKQETEEVLACDAQ